MARRLHETLMDVLARYETVEIESGISQPELTRDDTALLRAELTRRHDWPPPSGLHRVTFVLRDDRRWVGSETILLRGLRRLLPRPFLERLERRRQNRQVRLVSAGIRRSSPTVDISVVGVGEPGGMPGWISDLRTPRPTSEEELRWCEQLADSRTAVGVHGSHMLLPSLLSSAVVDLVPWFKLPNIGQDLVIADEASREPKTCLFRYRMIHANTGHRPLAEIIVSTLRDADYQYWTIVGNREAVGATVWPRAPGRWRELE